MVVGDTGYDANCAINADFVLIFTSNLEEIDQALSEVRSIFDPLLS